MSRHVANDVSESWKEYGRAQRQRRTDRLPIRQGEILALRAKGFDVQDMNGGYQFRVDGKLDLYPIHRRYHVLQANQRGTYQNVLACAVKFLRSGATQTKGPTA